MKIRNGFVSNSSSSSFIMVGMMVSNETIINRFSDKEQYKLFMEDMFEGEMDVYEADGGYIVGYMIDNSSDEYMPDGSFPLAIPNGLMHDLKKLFPDATENDVMIYYGTRRC